MLSRKEYDDAKKDKQFIRRKHTYNHGKQEELTLGKPDDIRIGTRGMLHKQRRKLRKGGYITKTAMIIKFMFEICSKNLIEQESHYESGIFKKRKITEELEEHQV